MKYFIDPDSEASYCQVIARICKHARKKAGLSLEQLSQKTGISHQALLCIEAEKYALSASSWITLSNALGVPIDSLKYGYIDRLNVDDLMLNRFDLPSEYRQGAHIFIRDILPIFLYMDVMGITNFEELLSNHLGIDPSYVLTIDHKVNHFFVAKLLFAIKSAVGKHNVDDDEFIYEILDFSERSMKNKMLHGRLSDKYDRCETKSELLRTFVESREKYETLYRYKFIQSVPDRMFVEVKASSFLFDNYDKMSLSFQVYLYDKMERNILGMSAYPIDDKRVYHLKELKNPIKNDFDHSFLYEVFVG